MEQKTEASQAVDPDMLDAVTSKVAEFYPQSLPRDMEKNQRLARAILRLVNRAALKAQPAPTEAAQPTRQALQAEGKHPAPCARHCEATAFGIEIRRLTAENAQLRAAQGNSSNNSSSSAQGGKLLELFKLAIGTIAVHDQAVASRIAKMYRSDAVIPASVAAQGEDSAWLDAERDVLAERQRQVETEGWTTAQDDEYKFGELAKAAICYVRGNRYVGAIDKPIDTWPFNHGWWKPTTDRRNLVKAGALIIAEIERIDRARASAETGGVKS